MTIRPIGLAALLAAGFTFAFMSSSSADDRGYRSQAGLLMQVDDDDDDDDDRPRRAVRGHYRSYHHDDHRRWHGRYSIQRYAKVCRTVWMHDDWGRSWRQTICR